MSERGTGLAWVGLAVSGLALAVASFALVQGDLGWAAGSRDFTTEDSENGVSLTKEQPQNRADGNSIGVTKLPRADAGLTGESSGKSSPSTLENPARTSFAKVWLPETEAPGTREELENEALFVSESLLSDFPKQAMALHVKAILMAQLHKTAEAQRLWKQCIELAPDVEPYYLNFAANALDRGDSQEALDILRKAVEKGLDTPDILHHMGLALTNLGENQEAVSVLKQALEETPNSAGHWLVLGQAQLKKGDVEEAFKSLNKAVELGAKTRAAYFALANASMRLGKREQAKEFRDVYVSMEKEDDLEGAARYEALSESEARRISVSVHAEAAAVYRAAGMLIKAEHLLLRVLALDLDNLAALTELAEIYAQLKRPADVVVVRDRIAEIDPFALMNYLRLARAAVDSGDPARAEAAIKLAISLAPQMITGYSAMAEFLVEQGKPEEAEFYVEEALLRKPSIPGLRLLSKVLRMQGKEQQAQAADEQIQNLMAEQAE